MGVAEAPEPDLVVTMAAEAVIMFAVVANLDTGPKTAGWQEVNVREIVHLSSSLNRNQVQPHHTQANAPAMRGP